MKKKTKDINNRCTSMITKGITQDHNFKIIYFDERQLSITCFDNSYKWWPFLKATLMDFNKIIINLYSQVCYEALTTKKFAVFLTCTHSQS